MATVIRLRRGGRTHSPYYRIVVTDSRTRNRGRELEIIGIYHPCARPQPVSEVDAQKALKWLREGAQPSATAKNVLSRLGIMKHFHEGTEPDVEQVLHKGAEVVDKGYNAPPPPSAEAPAEEAPAEAASEEAPAEAAAEETPAEGGEAAAEGGEAEASAEGEEEKSE